ncbi:hypothetical protein J5N97_024767 [Dioscorea zingiberensis]|uniref:Uncharacterized protein n=1 Tax=Dioscorea zingiberensis TaxID=325984 RepID=A0A9D5C7K1_9LILI|nr:hypothetical protein J5N97_024767 [Dioscorea zingiberensis]
MLSGNSENEFRKKAGVLVEKAPMSARALEVVGRKEELLGLLQGLPEEEYELSLTELVERELEIDGTVPVDRNSSSTSSMEVHDIKRSFSLIKERKNMRSIKESMISRGRGVLLNVYMPASLTRSLTTSNSSLRSMPISPSQCRGRDRKTTKLGCWPAIWRK